MSRLVQTPSQSRPLFNAWLRCRFAMSGFVREYATALNEGNSAISHVFRVIFHAS